MKRNCVVYVLILALCLPLLVGCGKTAPAGTEEAVGLPNPVKPSSREEIAERFGVDMAAPEGAEEVAYSIIDGEAPLAQLVYNRSGLSWCFRAAKSAGSEDISGMYYEWARSAESDFGARLRWNDGEAGVIERYDAEEGRMLSLSLGHGADESVLAAEAALLFPVTAAQQRGEAFRARLEEAHGSYFPGTAGSSLSASAQAAKLADFFAESGMSPEEARALADAYLASLPADEAELMRMQLDGIAGAFGYLTDVGGQLLLASCGYEAQSYPWEDAAVRGCIDALRAAA